ncbi:hypothetical protein BUALT_Bualt19G0055200 [Buddleja alternifolia]|uniref:DDE Tnp4 domain-containing protein n=1 Tax=Buddleja alternifolia TaxID=168488 RepID=A0AAV6W591_9LAMI|nr:hypothetical protein BUALT_Bualt19G0055200 [Buddleja alternifolia]
MDECTEHEELFVLLEEILSHSQILLLALYRVYRARKRRRILLDHVGHHTYSLTTRVPKQLEILHDIISYTDEICVDYLRMDRNAFGRLCYLLENVGGLVSTKNVQIPEQVAYFLLVLAHHTKNRIVKNGFKRFGHTISKDFNAVLNAIIKLHPLLLSNSEPVPDDSTNDRWKWFKGCLGALDGTHIPIRVPVTDKPRYRNMKGDIVVNVLGVSDTNMKFVYILTGWEGSAADSWVLKDVVARVHGLQVPNGNYYLCDGGYTNCDGFLTPYRGVRYHTRDWVTCPFPPQNCTEFFNKTHAKARNVIERAFGLLKMPWAILRSHSFYPIKVHNRIIMACCLLQNYIRSEMLLDPLEAQVPEYVDPVEDHDVDYIEQVETSEEWASWRDNLARSITMAANSSRARKVPAREHTGKSRRVWSIAEEKVLVSAMKDLVARGYKADNGFKTGYLGILEHVMLQAFPLTDIRQESHINSKVHVWKKNYGTLATMMTRSGFTLNSTPYTIEVESDEAWDNFVKYVNTFVMYIIVYFQTDNNARMMRYKSWPFYTQWRDIFGKDRATGGNAEGFVKAVQGLFNKDTQIQSEDEHEHTPTFHLVDCGGSRLFTSMTPGESSATGKGKSSKKRKSIDDGDDRFIELFSMYCEKISDIAKRADEASNQRKVVFDALDVMKELGVEEKISVSKFLVNNTKDLELFFSLTEANKSVMVKIIVEGRYRSG